MDKLKKFNMNLMKNLNRYYKDKRQEDRKTERQKSKTERQKNRKMEDVRT